MVEKPSDLNEKNTKKYTRRRVFKLASAAGFSGATALALTPEDIKASDSDQVTIAFDTEGNTKKRVPADWYDNFRRAKRENEKIKNRFKHSEGISSIGMSAGTRGGDNPHLIVGLNENSDKKDERRGELPERSNGVRIDIVEEDPSKLTEDCDDEHPDTSDDHIPGSVKVTVGDRLPGYCTLGPRFINGSNQTWDFGWSLASHCTDCGLGEPVYLATGLRNHIGNIVFVDHFLDIAYVEPRNGFKPESIQVFPSDHSTRTHIEGTVSEDGVGIVESEDWECRLWATTTCETTATVNRYDLYRVSGAYKCTDNKDSQVEFDFDSETEGGDSGGLWHVREEGTRDFYAIASHAASTSENAYGPQGYTIRDDHNIWWDNL